MKDLDALESQFSGQPSGEQPSEAASADRSATLYLDDLLPLTEPTPATVPLEDVSLRAVLEALIYVADEPMSLPQLSAFLQQPAERVRALLDQLIAEFDKPEHGVSIREVAGGYKMATKPEHHEAVRAFAKSLKPPLKLSLPALETLAVIAYKQPATAPEIMEIRGVQGAGVLKTLLDRKLIGVAGRKNVVGKPILYKTTKEFLIQFGLKDLSELPTLKEFEEIRRMAFDTGQREPDSSTQQASASAASGASAAEDLGLPAAADAANPGPDPGNASPDSGNLGPETSSPETSTPHSLPPDPEA